MGGVVGGFISLLTLGAVVLLYLRHRRSQRMVKEAASTPSGYRQDLMVANRIEPEPVREEGGRGVNFGYGWNEKAALRRKFGDD